MGRSIASVVAGLVAGIVLMMAIQAVGMIVVPLPPEVDARNTESLKAAMATGKIPFVSLLVVLFSHGAASLLAGWVCGRIAKRSQLMLAGVVGGVLTLAGISNLMLLPHPVWFAVLDLLLYLPCAYAGGRLAPAPPSVTAPEA